MGLRETQQPLPHCATWKMYKHNLILVFPHFNQQVKDEQNYLHFHTDSFGQIVSWCFRVPLKLSKTSTLVVRWLWNDPLLPASKLHQTQSLFLGNCIVCMCMSLKITTWALVFTASTQAASSVPPATVLALATISQHTCSSPSQNSHLETCRWQEVPCWSHFTLLQLDPNYPRQLPALLLFSVLQSYCPLRKMHVDFLLSLNRLAHSCCFCFYPFLIAEHSAVFNRENLRVSHRACQNHLHILWCGWGSSNGN